MDARTQRGFTLYELLVTILVMGVIFGFGIPNLLEFARNNRMAATANDLVSALHLARNEAVKARVPVTLCASPEPLADNPSCDADASDTGGGYIVWIDLDADAIVDAGEQILAQRDDPQDITVFGGDDGGGVSGYVHFGRNGFFANAAGAGNAATQILFCDARGNNPVSGSLSAARALLISVTGRPALLVEVDEIATLDLSCP